MHHLLPSSEGPLTTRPCREELRHIELPGLTPCPGCKTMGQHSDSALSSSTPKPGVCQNTILPSSEATKYFVNELGGKLKNLILTGKKREDEEILHARWTWEHKSFLMQHCKTIFVSPIPNVQLTLEYIKIGRLIVFCTVFHKAALSHSQISQSQERYQRWSFQKGEGLRISKSVSLLRETPLFSLLHLPTSHSKMHRAMCSDHP